MLDEVALRRDGTFRADVPVTLSDGQCWHLPKPRVRTRRRTVEGRPTLGRATDFGADYDQLLDVFYASEGPAFILAQFDLAAFLLKQNYALTDDQIDELVVLDLADDALPEDVATLKAIQQTIQGIAPKPMGSGDDRDYS